MFMLQGQKLKSYSKFSDIYFRVGTAKLQSHYIQIVFVLFTSRCTHFMYFKLSGCDPSWISYICYKHLV